MSQKDDRDLDAPTPPGGPMRRDLPDDPEAHEDADAYGTPPGEHDDELPDESDTDTDEALQDENAETSLDQPSS